MARRAADAFVYEDARLEAALRQKSLSGFAFVERDIRTGNNLV
jgi:hypothetical protein